VPTLQETSAVAIPVAAAAEWRVTDALNASKEGLMGWTIGRLKALQDTFLRKRDIEDEIGLNSRWKMVE
jgi:hypothetical protein